MGSYRTFGEILPIEINITCFYCKVHSKNTIVIKLRFILKVLNKGAKLPS